MTSYQKMLSYHYSDSSCADKLSQFDKNYVQQKLQLGLARLDPIYSFGIFCFDRLQISMMMLIFVNLKSFI